MNYLSVRRQTPKQRITLDEVASVVKGSIPLVLLYFEILTHYTIYVMTA